jgi:hypothetical protein
VSASRRGRPPGSLAGQASVETALVLPVLVVVALVVLQAGLLARDQLVTIHVARTAARAAAVGGVPAAVSVVARSGVGSRSSVGVAGDVRPGGLATVTVTVDPTRVPVVGRGLGGLRLRERLTVLIEGP